MIGIESSGYTKASSSKVHQISTDGIFEGEVISNVDSTGQGRVKVKIRDFDPESNSDSPKDEPVSFGDKSSSSQSVDENKYSGEVQRLNGSWAKPCWYSTFGSTQKIVNGSSGKDFSDESNATTGPLYTKPVVGLGGFRKIPKVGSKVICFFVNGDPQRLHYLYGSLGGHVSTDLIGGKTAKDIAKASNILIFWETELGDYLYADENEEARAICMLLDKFRVRAEFNDNHRFFQISTDNFTLRMVDKSSNSPISEDSQDKTNLKATGDAYFSLSSKSGLGFVFDEKRKTAEVKTAGGIGMKLEDSGKKITVQNGQVSLKINGNTLDVKAGIMNFISRVMNFRRG